MAGFPPTTEYGSTSFTTTLPAAITAPCPIVTPDKIVTPYHIHTSSPTSIGPLHKASSSSLKQIVVKGKVVNVSIKCPPLNIKVTSSAIET